MGTEEKSEELINEFYKQPSIPKPKRATKLTGVNKDEAFVIAKCEEL